MTAFRSRVAKLEAQTAPAPKVMIGFIDYDATGQCVAVTLDGNHFDRINDEAEAVMIARAEEAVGPADTFIWMSWKRPGRANLELEIVGALDRAEDGNRKSQDGLMTSVLCSNYGRTTRRRPRRLLP